MKNIFNNIKLKMKMIDNWIGNLATTLSLTISMMGNINELLTGLVLLSAFLLNLSGIYKNYKRRKEEEKEK